MGLWKDGGDLEHLACTLAVGGSDDGRVDVQESALLEELMCRVSQVVADASHSSNQVGAGSQVGLLTKELVRVLLLSSKRVCLRVAVSKDLGDMTAVGL